MLPPEVISEWNALPSLPLIQEGDKDPPTSVPKEALPDLQFVDLPHGRCAYRVFEPSSSAGQGRREDLPLVLALHGLTSASFVFEPIAHALSSGGHARLVTMDFYGRGMSPWPSSREVLGTETFMAEQAKAVVETVSAKSIDEITSITVIGFSMGGLVAVTFADMFASSVSSLVLLAPAGLISNVPFTAKLVRAPWLGELIMNLVGKSELLQSQINDFVDSEHGVAKMGLQIMKSRMKWQMKNVPGYLASILSTLRNANLSNSSERFKRVGRHDRGGLLIWGEHDSTCPVADSKLAQTLMPNLQLHIVAGAAHAAILEQPSKVLQLIVDLLHTNNSPPLN